MNNDRGIYSGRWCWAHSFSICRKFVVSTVFASKEQTSKRLNLLRLRCLYNNFGGDGEDRTPDLCNANATLSQLSYAPIANTFYHKQFDNSTDKCYLSGRRGRLLHTSRFLTDLQVNNQPRKSIII